MIVAMVLSIWLQQLLSPTWERGNRGGIDVIGLRAQSPWALKYQSVQHPVRDLKDASNKEVLHLETEHD